MRRYLINNQEVTKQQWGEAFKANPEATVILRTNILPQTYSPPDIQEVISPERAKEIRKQKLYLTT